MSNFMYVDLIPGRSTGTTVYFKYHRTTQINNNIYVLYTHTGTGTWSLLPATCYLVVLLVD